MENIISALLEELRQISLYLTDDTTAKLHVTYSLVKQMEMVENFVTLS